MYFDYARTAQEPGQSAPTVDKNASPELKWCFVSRLLCEPAAWQGEGGAQWFFSRLVLSMCPGVPNPAPCWDDPGHALQLCKHSHIAEHTLTFSLSQIQLFSLPWFFFSRFISVAHIQPPSSAHMSCAARLNKADKRTTVASLSSIFPSCEHSPACQLNFSASCSFFYPKPLAWQSVSVLFEGEPPKSTRWGCEPLDRRPVDTDSGQKNVFCQEGPAHMNISSRPVMLPPMTRGASGHPIKDHSALFQFCSYLCRFLHHVSYCVLNYVQLRYTATYCKKGQETEEVRRSDHF